MNSLLIQYRQLLIATCHLVIVAFSLASALLLRFDFRPPEPELMLLQRALWIALPVKTAVFFLARLNNGWWRFVGIADLFRLLSANVIASVGFAAVGLLTLSSAFPRSIYFVDFLLCFLLTAGARFAVRLYNEAFAGELSKEDRKGVLIYGAGAAGMMLLRELRSNPSLRYHVIGFLDDDPAKLGAVLMGLPVLGAGRSAALMVDRYKSRDPKIDEIIIAMPSVTGAKLREALANCSAAGVHCKSLPAIGELLKGQVLSPQIRNISLHDLLGREEARLDEATIRSSIAGKPILVTGAAGSIGSELCRQIARFEPGKLVVLDQSESELFKIDLELRDKFPSLNIVPEIGDIRDAHRMEEVIQDHTIDSVFHAAAYKHVPMMEAHPLEAVKNNVSGTWNLVHAAKKNQVSNFVMISSDKAVNPTSIMGVTKRVSELMLSAVSAGGAAGDTKFVSVRFGNVLGSNGSVVRRFQAQIGRGGPVTVTHPEMRRYFMTVREAVQLVLQASTMGKESEIFVLDMGEPIRILDLARHTIELAGLVPDRDIEIRFNGLRPGEKLCEELISEGENILPTHHEKIKIFQDPPMDPQVMEAWLSELKWLLAQRNQLGIVAHLKKLVPEYCPDRKWELSPDPVATQAKGNNPRDAKRRFSISGAGL